MGKNFNTFTFLPPKKEEKMENYENFKNAIDCLIRMLSALKEQTKKEDSLSQDFIDTMDSFKGEIEKYLKK